MVFEKIKSILSDIFEVDEDSIFLDTNIEKDLGAASLDVIDMMTAIEDEFEIEIPDDAVEDIRTVDQLVKYVEGLL